jgi:predicted DsbA family dithiol-disulfide isomerase
MELLEVFADVACPFAHAGLARFRAFREERGASRPLLQVRAWPLELVNGRPFDGPGLAPKVAALRAGVAPDRFGGFDAGSFPAKSLPAMAAEAAAHRVGAEVGERFSLAVRRALWDEGLDVADPDVLGHLRHELGVPEPTEDDRRAVLLDHEGGQRRGVRGSPHFFTPAGDFFCPSLVIEHGDEGYDVSFDAGGFDRFVSAVFP